jgi:ABC-type antimicrobial peptide transport system permease subunit
MAYAAAQRSREIGIRMALGAQKSDVTRLLVGEGMALGGAGLVVGIVTAVPLGDALSSLLYGVERTDPFVLASMGVLMLGVAMAASYLPARRATRTDPAVVLRYE